MESLSDLIIHPNTKLFLIIIIFIFGLWYYINSKNIYVERLTNRTNCPNLLIKKDDKFFMYNTNKENVPGVNPIEFNNLEEYNQFSKWLTSSGIKCPILYAEQTYDTQGQRTYKMLPGPDKNMNGLTPVSTTKLYDAGHDKGSMPGFDSQNQYIGDVTPLDQMFHQQEKYQLSDNPMDVNFGGPQYASDIVSSGVYNDNSVKIKTA